ncbi:methylated-DNA--[protein]-cysteine S-methyltransferase [Streptomyces prasinus]|uniref:methylated-DNA--[protein]-cysteine S-methyltransferase n=1 Tax=Streptomyces prasinus TaxID=67345 RepID=UPI00362F97B5
MDSHGQDGRRVGWAVVDTDIGPLLLAATREGLVNVVFHATDEVRDGALGRLASRLGTEPAEEPGSPLLAEAIRQVEAYFAGERRDFDLPLDWSLVSGFHREVLGELATPRADRPGGGVGPPAPRGGRPAGGPGGARLGRAPGPAPPPVHRPSAAGRCAGRGTRPFPSPGSAG